MFVISLHSTFHTQWTETFVKFLYRRKLNGESKNRESKFSGMFLQQKNVLE